MRLPPCHGQRPPWGRRASWSSTEVGLRVGEQAPARLAPTAAVQPCPAVTVADMPGSPVRGQWPGPRTGWQLHLVGLGPEPLQLTPPAGSATLEGPGAAVPTGAPCPVSRGAAQPVGVWNAPNPGLCLLLPAGN